MGLSASAQIFIVGAAETPLGKVYDHSEMSMISAALFEALDEAGLGLRDIDGLFTAYTTGMAPFAIADYLGLQPRFIDGTEIGGTSFLTHVNHAMLALASGRCKVALIAYASRQRTKSQRMAGLEFDPESILGQFEVPYGNPLPLGHFALSLSRHMHLYGTTHEQLAEVAIAARSWARLNPKAFSRGELTLSDAMASPMVVDPIRRVDCCLRTDGGGVLLLTTGDRARDARKQAVRVIGAGESETHLHIAQMPDLTTTAGAESARAAFSMAGIVPADVDVLQPYDAFTYSVVLAVEDLGFCKKGEGGPFVASGCMRPGGALPSMTSGGGLSYCHPGQFGILLLIEAVRQLRHEAGMRQVPDAEIAVAHGFGGLLSANSTVVLARN